MMVFHYDEVTHAVFDEANELVASERVVRPSDTCTSDVHKNMTTL
jgi:hypothetical protein